MSAYPKDQRYDGFMNAVLGGELAYKEYADEANRQISAMPVVVPRELADELLTHIKAMIDAEQDATKRAKMREKAPQVVHYRNGAPLIAFGAAKFMVAKGNPAEHPPMQRVDALINGIIASAWAGDEDALAQQEEQLRAALFGPDPRHAIACDDKQAYSTAQAISYTARQLAEKWKKPYPQVSEARRESGDIKVVPTPSRAPTPGQQSPFGENDETDPMMYLKFHNLMLTRLGKVRITPTQEVYRIHCSLTGRELQPSDAETLITFLEMMDAADHISSEVIGGDIPEIHRPRGDVVAAAVHAMIEDGWNGHPNDSLQAHVPDLARALFDPEQKTNLVQDEKAANDVAKSVADEIGRTLRRLHRLGKDGPSR